MRESVDSNAESCYFSAKVYISQGFSTIPVFGASDSSRFKQAAVRWGRYQHTLPQPHELREWFIEQSFSGLGLVCGRVSRLAVLDFDDPNLVSEFRHLYPDLMQTYTVRSGGRGFPHLYWRLPEQLIVTTRSAKGVDLRGEGAYVVAPPTRVGDVHWEVVSDAPMRLLSKNDLSRVLSFMARLAPVVVPEREQTSSHSFSATALSNIKVSELRHQILPVDDLLSRYQQLAPFGRNVALFKVACAARDSGWKARSLELMFAPVHARQQSSCGRQENYQQRYAEALKTIASVYTRPARPAKDSSPVSHLSNTIREALLQHNLDAAARVLDGLLLAGVKLGQAFSEREACEHLGAFGIGRRSVGAALKVTLADGAGLFPPFTPRYEANAATYREQVDKKCDMYRGANRVKTGRQPQLYMLPEPQLLAQRLGVEHRRGDPLRAEDVISPKAYRLALHRELVKRRPGPYGRRWLSARLGVSKWTTRRYEHAAHIESTPNYQAETLTTHNAQSLLPEDADAAPMGLFIQDEAGKRYPPLRPLALKLLKAGRKLMCLRQISNSYTLSVGVPTLSKSVDWDVPHPEAIVTAESRSAVGVPTLQKVVANLGYLPFSTEPTADKHVPKEKMETVGTPTVHKHEAFWWCSDCLYVRICEDEPQVCPRCHQVHGWQQLAEGIWRDVERLKSWWQNLWKAHHKPKLLPISQPRRNHPLNDPQSEALARHAHQTVADLSLTSARELVQKYGMKAVEQGMKLLRQRCNIRNAAGFLVTVARSEHLFLNFGG